MKKVLSIFLTAAMLLATLSGCGDGGKGESSTPSKAASETSTKSNVSEAKEANAEIVDGRFAETRKITVEVYDRSNDGGTTPDDNVYTKYIKEGMLRDHNVEVEFKIVPRWTEGEVLNNLLAANNAPDICVTYSYATILTYAKMGGITNLEPHIEKNKNLIPDLTSLITEDNLYYDQDPATKELWAIEGRIYNFTGQKTFVREDWLKKLNMKEPTNFEEYEKMLLAFKDNAELLLGENAGQMIPYLLTSDVGWHAIDLADATLASDLSDKDRYIYGFDDRRLMYPGYKEVIRVLNKWYNENLIWKDFPLYPAGDETPGNLIKSGYVGSYVQNSDDPYRNGDDGAQNTLKRLVSPDAAYITVPTFKNDKGEYKKYWSPPVDRKVFFPATNKEPVASLMYLNFISKVDTISYLQTGKEGVNHEKQPDGSVKILSAIGTEDVFNSPNNIDYTITCNGLHLGKDGKFDKEMTIKSLAQGYAGIDSSYIDRAFDHSAYTVSYTKNAKLGAITAETEFGTPLKEKRDNLLNQSVVAPVDQFDSIYDAGLADYMTSGGKAIIDERTAAWEAAYGTATMLDK